MLIVRAQQKLKSVKTLHVPMRYHVKNGNVKAANP